MLKYIYIPSLEHHYQYIKAEDMEAMRKIKSTPDSKIAQNIGSKVNVNSSFYSESKQEKLLNLLQAKSNSCPNFQKIIE